MRDVNLRRLPDDWDGEDEVLLQAVDDATATPIYIEYSFAEEWLEGVAAVIARLEDAGVDDSDGGRAEQFERLEQLRVEASRAESQG